MDFDFTDIAQTMAAMPPAPPKPAGKGSTWGGLLSAPLRGLGEASAQVLGTAADIGSAWRHARDATPEQRRAMDAGGVPVEQFSSDLGDSLRDRGREFRPDPMTAGIAEQLLYGFTRAGSKIVGGTLLAGPAGALAAGIEEGVSAADDLRREGVALEARSKVGVIQGAALAAAVLPVAGPTLKATAGLYLAGGPGGFIAQQAATRAVLKDAGYDEIAQRYDPLDPVGLALSALVPLPFAAWGAARNLRGPAPPKAAAAAADASMPPAAVAERAAPREVVDAAMVHNLTLQQQMTPMRERRFLQQAWDEVHGNPIGPADDPLARLTPDDVQAVLVERGPVALGADGVTVRAGGYGIVKFIWKHGPESAKDPAVQINRDDLAALPYIMRAFEPTLETGRLDRLSWVVDAPDGRRIVYGTSRFEQDGEHHLVTVHVDDKLEASLSQKRTPPASSETRASRAAGPDTAGRTFLSSSPEDVRGQGAILPRDLDSHLPPGTPQRAAVDEALRRSAAAREAGQGIEAYLAAQADLQPPVQNLLVGLAESGRSPARVAALMRELAEQVSGKGGQPGHTVDLADATATAVERVRSLSDEQIRGIDKPPAAPKSELMLQQVTDRVRQLEQQAPDMVVRTDAEGHPVTVAEELAAVRREAAEGTDVELGTLDADLLRVAAECAMNLGAL